MAKNTRKNDHNETKRAYNTKNSDTKGNGDQKRLSGKKLELEPASEKLVHQILPFVFIVIAIFLLTCFVLSTIDATAHLVGVVGWAISYFFFGLISWSAFCLPLLLLILAINWRRYIDNKTVVSKIVFPTLFLITLSALIHVIVNHSFGGEVDFSGLWENGTRLVGGGIIGGAIGEGIYAGLDIVGSIIILSPLALMFLIFSLGMTPRNMWIFIRYKSKVRSERNAEKKLERDEIKAEQKRERDEIKRAEREEKERELQRQKEEREQRLREEEEKKRLAKEAEDKRIEEAERRAREIEEKERKRAEEEAAIIKIGPVTPAQPKPAPAPQVRNDIEEGRIDLEQIFNKPPEEYNKKAHKPPVNSVAESSLEIEMKPITDIEGVPDDGEDEIIDDIPAFMEYQFPPIELLKESKDEENEAEAHKELMENAQRLMETLKNFNVRVQEINYSRGPTITRYELKPDVGVRIRSIANLVDDIALSLATTGVRIEAPIPNKAAVGVEVPNKNAAVVSLRSLVDTAEFAEKKSKLTSCLGKDVGGNPIFFDVGKMPHMLIAGTTGSGKSVCINCIIMSLLYKASPNDLKFILIDPKKVEFNVYKNIPHLYCPIVSDPKKAAGALASAVAEMERRFELIEEVGVRDIAGYNAVTADDPTKEHLPYMVIIIDELADLMMTAADDVETAICRIAQKARAAGIHLIVGTQRPSTDVITGLIKSNIPSRIAFAVASQVDSRTILDGAGAEKLIGRGDMLFSPIGVTKPLRVQGAFVSDGEVERIVEFLKENNDSAQFDDEFMRRMEEEAAKCGNKKGGGAASFDEGEATEEGSDPKFKAAVDVAIEMGKISTSLLQRRLEIGYGRAAKIIDRMEALGYVSAPDGNKPRQVLVTKMEIMEKRINDEIE